MAEAMQQISLNAIPLSIFLFAAAVFLFAIVWAACRITRMMQLEIATNMTLARELSAIQHSLAIAPVPGQPNQPGPFQTPFVPEAPSSAKKKGKAEPVQEGEIYAYDEQLMADQEAIRQLRLHKEMDQGGLSDEELDAQIAKVKASGFVEEP